MPKERDMHSGQGTLSVSCMATPWTLCIVARNTDWHLGATRHGFARLLT